MPFSCSIDGDKLQVAGRDCGSVTVSSEVEEREIDLDGPIVGVGADHQKRAEIKYGKGFSVCAGHYQRALQLAAGDGGREHDDAFQGASAICRGHRILTMPHLPAWVRREDAGADLPEREMNATSKPGNARKTMSKKTLVSGMAPKTIVDEDGRPIFCSECPCNRISASRKICTSFRLTGAAGIRARMICRPGPVMISAGRGRCGGCWKRRIAMYASGVLMRMGRLVGLPVILSRSIITWAGCCCKQGCIDEFGAVHWPPSGGCENL